MPPPTTLTGYYTEAKTYADNAVTSLQARVTQANADLATAQAALATATSNLAADQQANAALRIALSQAALPSDAANLVAELQQNMIQTRIDQAAVGTATDAAGMATRAQQAAAARLAAAQQAQQQAAAALTASQANDAEIAQWTQLVNGSSVTGALAAVNDPSVATKLSDAGTRPRSDHRDGDAAAVPAAPGRLPGLRGRGPRPRSRRHSARRARCRRRTSRSSPQ